MKQKVEWILKPGTFDRKHFGFNKRPASQPGLDLTRATFDILKDQSLVVTDDCCTYFPTFPTLIVADRTAPSETEMADIPIGGIFIAKESEDPTLWILWMKDGAGTAFDFGTNE